MLVHLVVSLYVFGFQGFALKQLLEIFHFIFILLYGGRDAVASEDESEGWSSIGQLPQTFTMQLTWSPY